MTITDKQVKGRKMKNKGTHGVTSIVPGHVLHAVAISFQLDGWHITSLVYI